MMKKKFKPTKMEDFNIQDFYQGSKYLLNQNVNLYPFISTQHLSTQYEF